MDCPNENCDFPQLFSITRGYPKPQLHPAFSAPESKSFAAAACHLGLPPYRHPWMIHGPSMLGSRNLWAPPYASLLFYFYLVGVYPPLWKILVGWDDEIPNIWKNKSHVPNHQPAMFAVSLYRIQMFLWHTITWTHCIPTWMWGLWAWKVVQG